jgi:hypothetical protein
VPEPMRILTGPAPAWLEAFGHKRIAGRATTRGVHRLRVRYMPHWEVRRGRVCVAQAPDGMTLLHVYKPGPFTLALDQRPADLVRAALGSGSDCVPALRK